MAMFVMVIIGIALFVMPQAEGENAVVRGYVYEEGSGTELEDVEVQLWGDQTGNSTQTDSFGYYEMGVPGGDYHVYGHKDGYEDHNIDTSFMNDTEYWHNFTIDPETAIVRGYIMEYESRGPIEEAWVNLWDGDTGGNGTSTDESGYYEMYASAGWWMIWANAV